MPKTIELENPTAFAARAATGRPRLASGWWIVPGVALCAVFWIWLASWAFAAVIREDRGGGLAERLAQIETLRKSGERIEIAGWCASSCTLYLALPNTCVRASARLGFHGPQSQFYGIGLPPAEFDHWSRIMAAHYPAPLAGWFMREGRHEILDVIRLSGREVIRMGAKEC